jgi:colanic acid/amylovoran biosynthesis glycosyltransferase
VHTLHFRELAQQGHPLLEGTLVLAMLNHELSGLPRQCRRQHGLCVANTELTLRTQWQIARTEPRPMLARLKTQAWLLWNHRRALADISLAHGLQCNGTPTFDAYAARNPNHLLYFDNRTPESQLVSPQDLQARFERMRQRGRPHLLFSGRLHAIKGAHHLVPMALALQQAGVDFELSIAGDGPLRSDIEAQIHAHGLQARVRCLGVLPSFRVPPPAGRPVVHLHRNTQRWRSHRRLRQRGLARSVAALQGGDHQRPQHTGRTRTHSRRAGS